MSVHNFPKKVFVELEEDELWSDDNYLYYNELNKADIGKQIATYELVSVGRAAVKLNKIKPEETL